MVSCCHVVAALLAQFPPGDTILLPPLDSAYGVIEPVSVRAPDPPPELAVWLKLDPWGRVVEARVDPLLPFDSADVRSATWSA